MNILNTPSIRERRLWGYAAPINAVPAAAKAASPTPTNVRGMITVKKLLPNPVIKVKALQTIAISPSDFLLLHRSIKKEIGKEKNAILKRKIV